MSFHACSLSGGENTTSAKRYFRVRAIHDLETRQQLWSAYVSLCRRSTILSSSSVGRSGFDMTVAAKFEAEAADFPLVPRKAPTRCWASSARLFPSAQSSRTSVRRLPHVRSLVGMVRFGTVRPHHTRLHTKALFLYHPDCCHFSQRTQNRLVIEQSLMRIQIHQTTFTTAPNTSQWNPGPAQPHISALSPVTTPSCTCIPLPPLPSSGI